MGLITGMLKVGRAIVTGSVMATGAVIVGTGAFVAGTVEAIAESNGQNISNTNYNSKLNPYCNKAIEKELTKLPKKVKKALVKNKITIEINDNAVMRQGMNVEGFYSYYDRKISLKSNEDSIEYALLHEIGHSLDHIAKISNEKAIRKSYERREVPFANDYFYSTIEEYIAQSISDYYNGILPKDTVMYRKLDVILFNISWDSIDEGIA